MAPHPLRERAVSLLETLVGFPSVSSGSNLGLIEFIDESLAQSGVVGSTIRNSTGEKANFFATIPALDGEALIGGVVLSGHTDVVPVAGQNWRSDPFVLTADNGLLYGRGAADMKGFIACVLAIATQSTPLRLGKPLHLAFSYDEEIGCLGVGSMLDSLGVDGVRPGLCIVGEPTSMRVVNANKGIFAFETVVHGLEAHSSAPDSGANAIIAAARCIEFLRELANEQRALGGDDRFSPPFTTFNVGMISGGAAVNIIPAECRFTWEYRPAPGGDPNALIERFERYVEETVLPVLRRTAEHASIVTEQRAAVPPLAPEENSPAELFVTALTGDNASGAVCFATEAGLFQQHGIPTVICGPGDIAQAHQPDEYISLDQIDRCLEFLTNVTESISIKR